MGRSQAHLRREHGRDSAGDGIRHLTFPSIAGTVASGQILTGTAATFDGNGAVTVTHLWMRRNPTNLALTATADTDLSYTLGAGDVGSNMVLRSTGTDAAGRVWTVDSAPTIVVA